MTKLKHFEPNVAEDAAVTISASTTTSNSIDLSGNTLCGVYTPTGFQGTSITFECAQYDGGTFFPVKDGTGATVSKVVSAGNYTVLDPSDFAGIRLFRIVSSATESADRNIVLAARPV